MVTDFPVAGSQGGVSAVIRSLAAKLGRQHRVLALQRDWQATSLTSTEAAGIKVYALRLRPPFQRSHRLFSFVGWLRDFPRALRQLRILVRNERIDIAHLHFASNYQFYFRLLRILEGLPYVVTLHGTDIVGYPDRSMLDRRLIRWTLRGAGRIIAVSRSLAESARGAFPELRHITHIHNGVDVIAIASAATAARDAARRRGLPETFFVMVGNVTYDKRQDIAIRAWSELGARRPEIHLVIIGEPRDHWDACQALIAELGCGDRVHMLGVLPQDETFGIMARAVGLVFPSRMEGFSMVLLEAGAMGLPAVCSRIPSFREIVEDGVSGLLVDPDDATAIASAVVRLMDAPELRKRLGRALARTVATDFSAGAAADRYQEAYYDALRSDRADAAGPPPEERQPCAE